MQAPQVTVPGTLEDAHEAVCKIAALLPKASVDQHERLSIGCLSVTIETHKRALLLLDGLCKAIDARGHRVDVRRIDATTASLAAVVDGDMVGFTISERLERTERTPSPDEAKAGRRIPKYDYWPGGSLRLDILNVRLARSMWSDTDTRKLDQVLGQALVGIEAAAQDQKRRREEEEQRKCDEEQRRLKQIEEQAKDRRQQRLTEYGTLLARDLDRLAEKWAKAKRVREFLDAYDAALTEEQRTDIARGWLEAARRYASRLDPLIDIASVAQNIEPPDEVLERSIANLKADEERPKRQ